MQLTSADRALADGIAAAHPLEPANDAGILFHITIREPDGSMAGETKRFVDSTDAADYGMRKGGLGSKVTVRPAVETTVMHGKLRYPHALHPLCSPDARAGWADAAAVAYAKDKQNKEFAGALGLQMSAQARAEWSPRP